MEYTFYTIICKDENITDCYVGSTNNFNNRKSRHKTSCNNPSVKEYPYKIYQFIRENGGFDNFKFVELEKQFCETEYDRLIRERYWIETLNATLNTQIPSRTRKEYNETNKEQISLYKKEYNETNKDKINQQKKEYYKTNRDKINQQFTCECGGKYTHQHKTTHFKTKKHQDYINTLN